MEMSIKIAKISVIASILFTLINPSESVNGFLTNSNNKPKFSIVAEASAQTNKPKRSLEVMVRGNSYTVEESGSNLAVSDILGPVEEDIASKARFAYLVEKEYISQFRKMENPLLTLYFNIGKGVNIARPALAMMLYGGYDTIEAAIKGSKYGIHAALIASLQNITKKGIIAVGKSIIGHPEAVATDMAKEAYNLGLSSWNRNVAINKKLIDGQVLSYRDAEEFLYNMFMKDYMGLSDELKDAIEAKKYKTDLKNAALEFASSISNIDLDLISKWELVKKVRDGITLSLRDFNPLVDSVKNKSGINTSYIKKRLELEDLSDVAFSINPEELFGDSKVAFDALQWLLASATKNLSKRGVYLVDISQKQVTRFIDDEAKNFSPSYPAISPFGKGMVFASNRDGNDDFYLMDISSSRIAQLTNVDTSKRNPSWSKNGRKLVYRSGDFIYTMNLSEDVCNVKVADAGFYEGRQFFSSDDGIIYTTESGIMDINVDGSNPHSINLPKLDSDHYYLFFQWWPGNDQIGAIATKVGKNSKYSGILLIDKSGNIRTLRHEIYEGELNTYPAGFFSPLFSQDGEYMFYSEHDPVTREQVPRVINTFNGEEDIDLRTYNWIISENSLIQVGLKELLPKPEYLVADPESAVKAWFNSVQQGDIDEYFRLGCGDPLSLMRLLRRNSREQTVDGIIRDYGQTELKMHEKLEIFDGLPKDFDKNLISPWYVNQRHYKSAVVQADMVVGDNPIKVTFYLVRLGKTWRVTNFKD